MTRIERLNKYGYKTIHIIGNLYLVRNYGNSKKLSIYLLKYIKDEKI